MKHETIDRLEVILKVTERCNINCSYCYYFNGTNNDHHSQPAHISTETVEAVAAYLSNAAITHSIKEIQVDLHGGEPLLIKKSLMADMLSKFRGAIPSSVDLRICIQTNGTLLDDEWISILGRHDVAIGISLDGPAVENDSYRVDKKGRGTHATVTTAIKNLKTATKERPGAFAGLICVINPNSDGRKTYRHFVDDLGVKRIHFLSPNQSRDTANPSTSEGVTNFLLGALDEWINDNDLTIHVRQFTEPLKRLCSSTSTIFTPTRFVTMTIRADGQIAIDDDLRNTLPSHFKLGLNVKETNLSNFLHHPAVSTFQKLSAEASPTCLECGARPICGSGSGFGESILLRYSFANKFRNASLHCSIHKEILIRLGKFAISHGVPWATIERNMSTTENYIVQLI